MAKQKILTVIYNLPPELYPQSIQIGRLLYYLADDNYYLYVVSSYGKHNLQEDFYQDIYSKFYDLIKINSVYSDPLIYKKAFLLPFIYKCPDAVAIQINKLSRMILKKWHKEKFDYLITFAYPFSDHLIGLNLKKYFKCLWIAHFSDPWVDNPLMGYSGIIKIINQYLEKKIFYTADKLVFVSEEMKDFYSNKYPALKTKMFVVEHSFDQKNYPQDVSVQQKNYLLLRYLGSFYGARNPVPFFKTLSILKESIQNLIRFEIVGCQNKKIQLQMLILKYGIRKIVNLIPFVSYITSLSLMKSADVLLVIDAPAKKSLFLPSKLIEYIGAKRPIFAITPDGPTKRVVSALGGWVANPLNQEEIQRCLLDIISKWKNDGLALNVDYERIYNQYNITTKIKEFKQLLTMGYDKSV